MPDAEHDLREPLQWSAELWNNSHHLVPHHAFLILCMCVCVCVCVCVWGGGGERVGDLGMRLHINAVHVDTQLQWDLRNLHNADKSPWSRIIPYTIVYVHKEISILRTPPK